MFKLLIFDWDGTLIDSAGRIVSCMQQAAHDLHYPPLTDEAVRNIIGLGLPEALRMLIPGIDDHGIVKMRERYGFHFFSETAPASELFANVEHTLTTLQNEGYQLAVATGKSRRGLERAFVETGLGRFFTHSRCADETQSKPHPQMLHELLQVTGISSEHALMIGDTEFDLDMAARAQIRSCGVSYGVHDVERLEQFQPIAIIDNINELTTHLPPIE